jgi:hypothetical protein
MKDGSEEYRARVNNMARKQYRPIDLKYVSVQENGYKN